jgi:hypothetical protein
LNQSAPVNTLTGQMRAMVEARSPQGSRRRQRHRERLSERACSRWMVHAAE